MDIKSAIRSSRPNLEEITINTYTSRIEGMMKREINFANFEDTINKINEAYASLKTKKSCITAIVVYLKATNKENVGLIEKYSAELLNKGEEITKIEQKNEKGKDILITRQEIQETINKLKNEIGRQPLIENNEVYFDTFQKYTIVSLYYLILPLRNDYVDLEVYEEPIFFPDTKKNYIYLSNKQLVLNRYKTSKIYGTNNIIELPDELVEIIREFFRIRSIIYKNLEYKQTLLLNKNKVPMTQVNLTQYLNRIFGKKVSSTSLRKSYITEKYPVLHTNEEMINDARKMTHSVSMQQSTYRKKN